MAFNANIATLSLGASRIIALLIIVLSPEATVKSSAITLSTSNFGLEAADYDDTPIDQLLSAEQSTVPSGSRGMMHSDDGIVRAELDLLFTEEQWESRQNRNRSRYRRKAAVMPDILWPNATVPYELFGSFSENETKTLRMAMQQFQAYSCVRFRPRTYEDKHYVQVTLADVCESHVGRQSFPQPLRLSHGCATRFRVVVHELGHALGFEHEHNRPDRDEFVTINESNIVENMHYNFEKAFNEEIDTFDVPYDYLSIMHYSDKAFSKNPILYTTIQAKNSSYQKLMGKSNGLKFNDIKQLNKMYRCAERNRCARRMRCPGDGFVGHDCRCYCRTTNLINSTRPAAPCSECADYDEMCSVFRQCGFCTHRLFSDHMTYRCPQACNRC